MTKPTDRHMAMARAVMKLGDPVPATDVDRPAFVYVDQVRTIAETLAAADLIPDLPASPEASYDRVWSAVERINTAIREQMGTLHNGDLVELEPSFVKTLTDLCGPDIPDLPTECEACGEGQYGDYGPGVTETRRAFQCGAKWARGVDVRQIVRIEPCSRAHELLVKMKVPDTTKVPK